MEKKQSKFMYYFRIYFKIIGQDIKSKMSYRGDFILSTIGMIFTNISGVVAFWVMFQNFPSVNGWTYNQMLFLYAFSLLALTPVQCLFDNNWNLRQQVYSGDFIKYCFRPMNIFFYFISEVFDLKGLGQFAIGLGLLIYSWIKLAIPVTFFVIIKLILGIISASLFMIAIMNLAASSCFWIIYSGYVMTFAFKFKDYAKYPVTIFNTFFRILFTFIIPIAFIAYYPSLAVLKPDNVPVLTWLSPLLGAAFFYLSYKVWMYGATKYSGTGS